MILISRWPRRVVRSSVALTLALVLVTWGLPHFVSSSPLRDRMVTASLTGVGLEAEAEAASFGWFAPTSVKGLKAVSANAQVDLRAEELRISQAWWQLVLFPDQLGHLEVTKPSVTLLLDARDIGHFSLGKISPFTANLEDAEFNLQLVGMDKPVISVGGLSVQLQITHEGVSYLDVQPGRVFDHRPLSAEMCDGLLQLLDPTLSDIVRVEGSFSLDVKRLRVPLDVTPEEQIKQVDFEGILHLHGVTIGPKTPLLKRMLRVASDLHGKQPSEAVHVVEENQIHLQVRQGRIYYDHLALGFSEISPGLRIHSNGSVGLDGSIDLRIVVPEELVANDSERTSSERTSSERTNRVAVVRISGTVDQPRIERLSEDEAGVQGG